MFGTDGLGFQRLKDRVKRLDNLFMKGLLQLAFERLAELVYQIAFFFKKNRLNYTSFLQKKSLDSHSDFKIETFYQKNYTCTLANLCDIHGTDKGGVCRSKNQYPPHSYSDFYATLYAHCRNGVLAVFECGIGTIDPKIPSNMGKNGSPGASLRVWRDYFPNAQIFGADIDRSVLFEENRIKTFYLNQLIPNSIFNFWQQVRVDNFDLMVDDGLHTFEAGSTLFTHSIDKLASHGIYVIEDVYPSDLLKYRDFFQGTSYHVEFVCLNRPNMPLSDNSLVVIRKPQVSFQGYSQE